MNDAEVRRIFEASRNGANRLIRHALCRNFVFSDGVYDLANQGCHWLLDILATEGLAAAKKCEDATNGALVVITLHVAHEAMVIRFQADDDKPPFWERWIKLTDFPAGKWTLYGQFNEDSFVVILPSEW